MIVALINYIEDMKYYPKTNNQIHGCIQASMNAYMNACITACRPKYFRKRP